MEQLINYFNTVNLFKIFDSLSDRNILVDYRRIIYTCLAFMLLSYGLIHIFESDFLPGLVNNFKVHLFLRARASDTCSKVKWFN